MRYLAITGIITYCCLWSHFANIDTIKHKDTKAHTPTLMHVFFCTHQLQSGKG